MPSHRWWQPRVFPSFQPPSEAYLSYCPCHIYIPPGSTENSWDGVSWAKNVFPSFSGASSRLPENTAVFWNPILQFLGFALQFQRKGETWVPWATIGQDHEETVQWPLLFWGEEEGGHAADVWVSGSRDWTLCGQRTWEGGPNLTSHAHLV